MKQNYYSILREVLHNSPMQVIIIGMRRCVQEAI